MRPRNWHRMSLVPDLGAKAVRVHTAVMLTSSPGVEDGVSVLHQGVQHSMGAPCGSTGDIATHSSLKNSRSTSSHITMSRWCCAGPCTSTLDGVIAA